jgi:hypothetical protein
MASSESPINSSFNRLTEMALRDDKEKSVNDIEASQYDKLLVIKPIFIHCYHLLIAIITVILKSNLFQSISSLTLPQPNHSKTGNFPKEKDKDSWGAGVLSCLMYTFCSVFMVLSNKAISSSLPTEARKRLPQLTVILFQCLVAVLLVESAKLLKIVEYPRFNWKTARAWLPLNLLFIGMLITGFLSLVYVSVPMVTVFKNLTNLVTVTGDYLIFGEE